MIFNPQLHSKLLADWQIGSAPFAGCPRCM